MLARLFSTNQTCFLRISTLQSTLLTRVCNVHDQCAVKNGVMFEMLAPPAALFHQVTGLSLSSIQLPHFTASSDVFHAMFT